LIGCAEEWYGRRQAGRRAGFTLIELLIAVAAFAIVLAAINAVYYAAIRLRNKTTVALENALPLEHAVTILKRDLAGIVLPGGTLFGPFQTSSTSNNVAGQASPNFYTSTGVVDENSPWADVQRVSYLLVNSTNRSAGSAGKDLIRAVTRNLLPALQDQQEQQWLLTGVQTVTFLYHDGTQWRDSWDSTMANPTTGLSNSLPKAIKVQIQLVPEDTGNPRGRRREPPVELVVPISAQARTNLTQQASGGTQ
jgi:general secretion pathway protein J